MFSITDGKEYLAMRDPQEGLDSRGFIVTGVARDRIPCDFWPIVDDVIAAVDDGVSVYVYGSVATGQARLGESDVDVVTLGMDPGEATMLGRELSARYAARTRGVAIGAWTPADLADGDAGYGNRVFLKHYCAWLAGPDLADCLPRFPGDVAAARGFNGDFPALATRWTDALEALNPDDIPAVHGLARRVGRKSLFAVSSMASVHDSRWTTDRATAAARWAEVHSDVADDLGLLLAWGDDSKLPSRSELRRILSTTVGVLVDQFVRQIGAWRTIT
ncbi:nucleotidyltransferase domain-containing protein [Luteococcus sp. H138]|uniref:nucleotidyltransferase domain-containing protein n=1 Tax=Luteococcus sp. H91 TaxID=3139401 RepID=UPI00313B72C9